MKGIVITEKNYRQVAGRLKKFFAHKNFIVWHTFNGGMRPRFNHHFYSQFIHSVIDTKREYYDVQVMYNNKYLCIYLNYDQAFIIDYGDEILFLGSRIVIKSHEHVPDRYVYETFQIISE